MTGFYIDFLNLYTSCEQMDWIRLSLYRVQWSTSCERGNEPSDSIRGSKFLTCLATVSFPSTLLYEVSYVFSPQTCMCGYSRALQQSTV
jgi:hypothetical protein